MSLSPLSNRVALVTGANTGIGRVTARELARSGATVVIATRSRARSENAIAEARSAGAGRVEWLELDLGHFDSVRHCATEFLRLDLPLHLLVNNAGVAGRRGLTSSGFEFAFGVNHLGHFLLTQLLMERLRQSGPSRVVTVASRAHVRAQTPDWDALRRSTASLTGMPEYSVSKLANVLFSAELARRLASSGVTTYALHPGVVASDIWRSVPAPLRWLVKLNLITTDEGAKTTLYCADSPDLANQSGLYYERCGAMAPSRLAQDTALAAELWRRSEAWVSQR